MHRAELFADVPVHVAFGLTAVHIEAIRFDLLAMVFMYPCIVTYRISKDGYICAVESMFSSLE